MIAIRNGSSSRASHGYIVTLLARKINSEHLAAVTTVTSDFGLNIDKIVRLSGRVKLDETEKLGRACVEFSVRGEPEDPSATQKCPA